MNEHQEAEETLQELPFRGFHYDIARGAYVKPAYFIEAMALAAEAGFTHFLPYLENMIRLPSIEKACPSCAYTPGQWRAFENAARGLGIELVPHFNVIGHAQLFCTAYPELASATDALEMDVTSPAVGEWTLRSLSEFCELSRAPYFLIGGDEWQPADDLLARPDFDAGATWVGHLNLAIEFLVARNRIPIIWHDVWEHFPAATDRLSRKATVAFWFYDEDSDYPVLDTLKKRGFRTLMASGQYSRGALSHRRVKAVQRAVAAAREYHADGFLMTDWEAPRFETLEPTVRIVGDMLRCETPPSAVVRAFSLYDCLEKLPEDSTLAATWRKRLGELLDDDAWSRFPRCRGLLKAAVTDDRAASLTSYLEYHYPEGRLYRQIRRSSERPSPIRRSSPETVPDGFGVTCAEHPRFGTVLRVVNEGETFAIYPKYGASLQDWRVGERALIAHSLPRVLAARDPQPGGYHSYSKVGGFRPIWALGAHNIPCILWQVPFAWSIVKSTCEQATFELGCELPHVAVRYTVGVTRGQSGFSYTARALNKLDGAVYGAFNFNLPLVFDEPDIEQACFEWETDGQRVSTNIPEEEESFFVVPARAGITVRKSDWAVTVTSDPDRTVGYYVDWSMGFVTPDLHGIYQPLARGDALEVDWTLEVAP